MYTTICGGCLVLSLIVLIYMLQKNYNNIDIYQWTIIILIPVVIMAYWIKSRVVMPEAVSSLLCFTYFDSTFMITTFLLALMHTLGAEVKAWAKIIVYGLAGIHLAIVGLCVNNSLYYRNVYVVQESLGNATKIHSGPLMRLHYIYLAMLLLWLIAILVLSVKRRGTYAKHDFFIYMLLPLGAFMIYIVEAVVKAEFTLLPIFYAIVDIIFAIRYDRAHLYDISSIVAESYKSHESRGYVALGLDKRFLCCNQESYQFLPILREQTVNRKIPTTLEAYRVIIDLIDSFERDGLSSAKFKTGNMTVVCSVSYFTIQGSSKRQGYFLDLSDGTEEQNAYEFMASYNETLNAEVKIRTEEIKNMQRKIVLGMADMIENRDNNTGGHVKRTSDIIRILLDEMQRQGKTELDEQMVQDIVRAAPTHDLGKITIDSSILNKPGRFTDEEYAIMKTHSSKSGEMVMILLDGIEEERFVKVAYNVARYHHERWDGRGYPEGLVGTMIPLEARIMAVADVYDALVSKRVYKEPMSFEKSAAIMCEGMGTQFDPNMKSVFLGCREKLEQYYIENDR